MRSYNMEHLNIVQATYIRDLPKIGQDVGDIISIMISLDGQEMSVPLDPTNRHYTEILRQVEAGELVIQDSDSNE